MSSKAKRVLPTRPDPPSAAQLLADVRDAPPGDPVFVLPAEPRRDRDRDPSPDPLGGQEERERLYRQSRGYAAMTQRLRAARERLRERREQLLRAGAALDRSIADMRQRAF
ncbi:CS025 protein, partial [Caloenas nicobarica]|nr:CS025 protein [Caloenas nicobarica]